MKKLLGILALLLLIAGVAVWYFVSFRLDSVIEHRIEQAASQSLGTAVAVGGVKTSIRDGSLEISSITVANPPGYRNANAFSLNRVEAAVDFSNFDIRRVVIERPEIVIEEMGGETNVSRMLAELERREGGPPPVEGREDPVIVIRHFRMNESRAAFESESLDRYSDLEIDAVELNDVRGTPDEVAKVIAAAVLGKIVKEAATELLKAEARKKLDDVSDKVSDKFRELIGADEPDDVPDDR